MCIIYYCLLAREEFGVARCRLVLCNGVYNLFGYIPGDSSLLLSIGVDENKMSSHDQLFCGMTL